MLTLTKSIENYADGDGFHTPFIPGFDIVDEMLFQDVHDNPDDYPPEIIEHYMGNISLSDKEIYDFMESLIDYDPESHWQEIQESSQ